MNRYVKIKGHNNWFLVLGGDRDEPDGFSELMQEKILRSHVCELHQDTPKSRMDSTHRLIMSATREIDYVKLAKKYGTILVRPIGSFMPINGNEIIDEVFDMDFPIDDYADIVICENDERAEYKWVEYLKNRFPNKKITTISYFDLRSDHEVEQYFSNAKYITFSTTFSNYDWYMKLSNHVNNNHKIIGYCHTPENWLDALVINNTNVEVVDTI